MAFVPLITGHQDDGGLAAVLDCDLEAWLEVRDTTEVRAAIKAAISNAAMEGLRRAAPKFTDADVVEAVRGHRPRQ